MNVTNEELLELTKKAFEQDEVKEFLCGEKGYSVHGNRDIPDNIPTDFGRIVKSGIYRLFLLAEDKNIIRKFNQAFIKLCNGSAEEIWCAYMLWYYLTCCDKRNVSPFIVDKKIVGKLKKAINKNQSQLRNCKKWLGCNSENGLWQEIVRIDKNLKERYGVRVL